MNTKAIIEAVLFASGDGVELSKLSEITQTDVEELQAIIQELADEYSYNKRGLNIIRLEDKCQMVTRGEYADYVQKIVAPRVLRPISSATLEVLAIIAYKQPVTRQVVEKIRGVDSTNSIHKLLERDLIEEQGKLDAPGRPLLFGTTDEFLRTFGLQSLNELPPLEQFLKEEGDTLDVDD